MKPKSEIRVRPEVNMERQKIKHKEVLSLDSLRESETFTLNDLVNKIRICSGCNNPELYYLEINNDFEIGVIFEKEETADEYNYRISRERHAQNRFDAIKRSEINKAKAILERYGETSLTI